MHESGDNRARAETRSSKGNLRRALPLVLLIAIAFATASNTLNNTALFHHLPDPYSVSAPDNSLLRS